MDGASNERGPRRLPGLDGLRAVAAGAVLVYHVWRFAAPDGRHVELGPATTLMPHLWHGVTLFFVLSGFLLYRPFAAAVLRGTRPPSVARYAHSRALRILPAYWVVLLVTAFVLQAALVRDPASGARVPGVPDGEVLAVNLLLLQNYAPETIFTGVGPAWSLGVELTFYALLPLLALVALSLAAARGLRVGAALAPVGVLLVVGGSGALAAATVVGWDLAVGRSLWGLAPLFGMGMLVAVASIEVEDGRLRLTRRRRAGIGAAALLVAGAALATGTSNVEPLSPMTHAYNLAAAVACALVVALVAIPRGVDAGALARALNGRAIVAVGVASYSAFLWHEPLLHWLRARDATAGGAGGFALNLALVVALTAVASALTYRLVERPALRLKRPRRRGRARRVPGEQAQAAP